MTYRDKGFYTDDKLRITNQDSLVAYLSVNQQTSGEI